MKKYHKNILELLKEHITQKSRSISSFCKNTDINRTTLQKTLSGDRTLTESLFQEILSYLTLTPYEENEIKEAFLISQIGYRRYYNRLFIKDFISSNFILSEDKTHQDFNLHTDMANVSKLMPENHIKLIPSYPEILRTILMIAQSAKNHKCSIHSYSLFEERFFSGIQFLSNSLKNIDISFKHIFLFDKKGTFKDSTCYNLQIFTGLISYMANNEKSISTHYIYENLEDFNPTDIVFPYYMIINDTVLLISGDFKSGMYINDNDTTLFYKNDFETKLNSSYSLIDNHVQITNFLKHIVDTNTEKAHTIVIEAQPCPISLINKDILYRTMKSDLPDDSPQIDAFIMMSLKRQEQIARKSSCTILFTKEGLDLIAYKGICNEVYPHYCKRTISVPDRITMLERLLDINKSGTVKYYIRDNSLSYNTSLSITLETPKYIMIQVNTPNNQTHFYEFRENTIYDAFHDFFSGEHIKPYIWSLEETNTYIAKLIEELKQQI